ncbi:hypothetical protein RYX36_019002 [Vicia faba]
MYVGTGSIFRRTTLCGFSPPRASEHHGWLGKRKIKLFLKKPKVSKKEEDEVCVLINCDHNDDDAYIESLLLPKRFGNSTSLAVSIPVAEYQGRLLQDSKGNGTQGRHADSLDMPRKPLDASTVGKITTL